MPAANPKQTLHYLFLAPVALAVILVIATLHYAGYEQYQQNRKSQTQQVADRQLQLLSRLGGEYIVHFEEELLNGLYQSLLEKEDIHALVIENHLTSERLGLINDQALPEYFEKSDMPIMIDGKAVGLITIIFDRQELHTSLHRAARLLIISFLLSATIIILSLWLLYRTQILAQLDIRHKQEEDIRRQHRFLQNLLESTNNLMLVMTTEGIIQHVNRACMNALEKTEDEMINRSIEALFYPIGRTNNWQYLLDPEKHNEHYEPFLCTPVDSDRPIIEWIFTFSSAGSEKLITGTGTNIEFEEDAQHKLYLAERIFAESSNALVITDQNNIITDVNNAFEKCMGYSHEEVLGQSPRLFKSGRHNKAFYTTMWKDILEKGYWAGELWNKRKSGDIFPLLASISAIKKYNGSVTHYLCSYHDITEKKKHEEKLVQLAHKDPLTGLPNRRFLNEYIENAILQAERDHSRMAVLYIDLDGFKKVNDKISHQAGDTVLQNLASKFKKNIRRNELVARLGGDEFCMVIPSLTDNIQAENIARRLIKECTDVMSIEGRQVTIGMSIGIAIYPDNGKTCEELISRADTAMYQVKNNGKDGYSIATEAHSINPVN